MIIGEFEELLWKRDVIRVVIRAPAWQAVNAQAQTNAASETLSITEYIRVRITNVIGNYECVVIDGRGLIVHGRTKLGTVRSTYRS
ncbi:MAG: hypothetical protein ACLQIQ_12815 [Beijerinckiaceae bacterium]